MMITELVRAQIKSLKNQEKHKLKPHTHTHLLNRESSCRPQDIENVEYYTPDIRRKDKNKSKLGVFHANQTSMCLDPHLN